MQSGKISDEQLEEFSQLVSGSILEYCEQVVAPRARSFVEIFEQKLGDYEKTGNVSQLEADGTEFVHAYEKLEQKLNNDYREQPKIKEIFATRSGEVFSEFLRKSTNNRMNDLFAPLKRILHGMG